MGNRNIKHISSRNVAMTDKKNPVPVISTIKKIVKKARENKKYK